LSSPRAQPWTVQIKDTERKSARKPSEMRPQKIIRVFIPWASAVVRAVAQPNHLMVAASAPQPVWRQLLDEFLPARLSAMHSLPI
jgi:hypothetical protein